MADEKPPSNYSGIPGVSNQHTTHYCSGCGSKLPDNARFCHVCGSPATFDSSTQRSISAVASGLNYPRCRKDDQVQKVSSIVAGQTHEISGGGYSTQVYIDKSGKKQYESQYVPYDGTQQSVLAEKLSPPVKPDAGWNLLGLGIIVLAGFGVFYGGIFGFLSSGRTGDPGMCISLSLILGLVGFVISAAAHSRRVDEIRKIELPAWEKAVQRWDRLYYCFRDDCIFDPQSGESVTAGNITDIINK